LQAQAKDYPAASATLAAFVKDYPRSAKRAEAVLLAGSILVIEEKFKKRAYFSTAQSAACTSDRGRAVVLELYSLVKSGAPDGALRLIMAEYPRSGELAQLVAFHTLILDSAPATSKPASTERRLPVSRRLVPRKAAKASTAAAECDSAECRARRAGQSRASPSFSASAARGADRERAENV
jgi:hypothetical protein